MRFKRFKNFYVPKIDNYNHRWISLWHSFFCESENLLDNIKGKFKIVKYKWPILDSNEHFHDPNKFLDLIYDNDPKIQNVFEKSNDIRDQLYFFDLKEIINFNKHKIKKKIDNIKKNEN